MKKALAKMRDAGVDEVAIETFAHYFRLLEHGETGMIPEDAIEPVDIPKLVDVEVVFRRLSPGKLASLLSPGAAAAQS